ncbi:PREDICTED: protein Skeletor, isoforms B/C-like isoform X1 [Branchiostoma belcheri]|uniref:Protein Skeletor, isoforms B/C-like isoform X1 n=1 Tax=Branchiostoma belcheri TaxID=7741 RepID=A0A6P4YS59_BRABE|nr:PREDICTED: protein Skeletor, isoforms B/C-like isoform X1 [Branchiostoma belcheri]
MSYCRFKLGHVAVNLLALVMVFSGLSDAQTQYYGRLIGTFPSPGQGGVAGAVYAVDASRLQIVGFSFDGSVTAQFRAGSTASPSGSEGVLVPDEQGSTDPLGVYNNKRLVLALPQGTTLDTVKWFSVWGQNANLGHVTVPDNFVYPRPRSIGEFSRRQHGVRSGEVTILNAKQFHIQNLHYDGLGPDAFFWAGNRDARPSPRGFKVPDHRGSYDQRLPRYTGQTITIMLPGDVTVYDIKWLSMWCIRFTANFGEVFIPSDLNVPPLVEDIEIPPMAMMNCEELHRDMQVSWTLTGEILGVELAGRVEDGDYMAFGISGCDNRACMVGSDVTVAFYDGETPQAVDYTLKAYSQCSGSSGVCPDGRVGGEDNNVNITGRRVNGITRIRYSRPINTGDTTTDKVIDPSQNMYISWAIGPINPSGIAAKHHTRVDVSDDVRLMFGREPSDMCEMISSATPAPVTPWPTRKIKGDWVTNFIVHIGPTGGRRGYEAITGLPSWGIAWWLNGLLIPELELMRGWNYTFIVEGGDNDTIPEQYHPFYITDDPIGGYTQKTEAEKQRVKVFAGVDENGMPTAAGRYCEYNSPTGDTSETSETFAEYKSTLQLNCRPGVAAQFTWTPDENTPDLVYYHCFTHQYLGWKIRVVDEFTSGSAGVHAGTLAVMGALVAGALSVLFSHI